MKIYWNGKSKNIIGDKIKTLRKDRKLTQKGLVKSLYQEGGDLVDIIITDQGEQYMAENPELTNPVNWAAVATIISVIGVLVSIATLFVSCV